MDNTIDTAVKRGRGYWFVDGFTELLAGVLFVLLGGALLARALIPQDSFLSRFMGIVGDVSVIKVLGFFVAIALLSWLKDRFTYPRTGFARGKRVTFAELAVFVRNIFLLVILPLLACATMFILIPDARVALFSMPAWLPGGLGVLWVVLSWVAAERMGLPRFRWLGAGMLVAGLAVGAWQWAAGFPVVPVEALHADLMGPLPEVLRVPLEETVNRAYISLGVLIVPVGVLFAVSGLITFLRYRKENPVPYTEES